MEMFAYEKEHLKALRSALAECAVLLRSDGSFPLESPGELAAYGCGVRRTIKGGTGSGEVNSRYFTTVEQGLKDAGFTLTTNDWLDGYDQVCQEAKKRFHQEIKAQAKAAHTLAALYAMGKAMPEPEYQLPLDAEGDAAIYVLARISGEGSDRDPVKGDILLTDTERRDILELSRKYERFMLVINAGGPVDLTGLEEVGNILVLSQLGVETGAALADILLGVQNPSGKLTTTWAKWEDYFPMPDFGDRNDTRYHEGIYVGYRYFDSAGKKPLFPFGFGLSYTTFETGGINASVAADKITVTARVTNTGSFPGKEVVQVYVSAPQGKLDKPYQDLAAFGKTKTLAPGENETLEITFSMRDLASFDEQTDSYILEKGNYVIRVGTSSADTQVAALAVLPETVTLMKVRDGLGKPDFADWKCDAVPAQSVAADVPVLVLSGDAFPEETISYDPQYEIDEAVKGLTDEQLIYANIGEFSGSLSIIGAAGKQVAGAAGESTSKAPGIPVMVMADGPAGLRLSRKFYRDEKGAHSVGQAALPESVTEHLPGIARLALKLLTGNEKIPKDATLETQYATAIPIGTALAQSWNTELAKLCGDIVGDEMERFGVHLWLAPALNIHRSIRCGRNFEYFSEDPLVSGLMAAALTNGVQAHPGCGTTIKHYCANNQETNRYGNNSRVSRRALREIYLKGFRICVQESQPKAVMTSYNLLNGEHTAQRRDLIDDVLRCEYGFKGIVMTDWVISVMTSSKTNIHPAVEPWAVAAAGSELFMPGGKGDFKNIQQGLQEGKLTRQQLRINVTRLLRMAKELTGK